MSVGSETEMIELARYSSNSNYLREKVQCAAISTYDCLHIMILRCSMKIYPQIYYAKEQSTICL